jgi:hypothetical protein
MRSGTWCLAVVLPLAFSPAGRAEEAAAGRYRLTEATSRFESASLAGDGFALEGAVAPRNAPQGEGFVLHPEGTVGCACFDRIFADGFEAGDTSAWSLP